jgi:predicted secreted Zn-dependent protease
MIRRSAGPRGPLVTAAALLTVLVSACMSLPSPATPAPSAAAPSAVASSTATPTPTGASPSSSASTSGGPTASAVAELLPIAGVWRVRKVLRAQDRSSGEVEDPTFDEETYSVDAPCDEEPCDALKVTTTPLGLTSPATVVDMTRDGAVYTSSGQLAQASSCVSGLGDRVDGGANTSSTLRLWVTTERPAGSSVASVALHGTVELDIRPTPIGEAAGCEEDAAGFELMGRREEVAVRNPDGSTAGPDLKPPAGAAFVGLRSITAKVAGGAVRYFDVSGDTSAELAESVGRGGAKACGTIDYEWYRGDARPSACTLTRVSDTRQSIRISTSASGSCRIREARITTSYVIYLPRWTDPSRVPKRLLDWWRRIVAFIADHEAGHVRIGRDYIRRLNAQLVGKPCEDLTSIVRSWASRHAAAQEAYDRSEYSRAWPQPAAGY